MSRTPSVRGIIPTTHPEERAPEVPVSPSSRASESLPVDLITPNNSPPSISVTPNTPVIVSNPNFLPPPPLFPRYSPHVPSPQLPPKPELGSSIPSASGRWDPLTNTPTYQRGNKSFWASRQLPIPVLSTVSSHLSGLGFTPRSDVSSEAFEELQEAQHLEEVFTMSRPTDPSVAAEADSLDDLKDRIEIQLDRMKPSRVNLVAWHGDHLGRPYQDGFGR
jgi:hypothetical protein